MKISIALASYNGSNYLKSQLDSFLVQSILPDELVISDDCSDDDTIKIIQEFSINAPFPVVLSQNNHNLGYSRNFNAALMKTTGDLVFLSDQDDVWFSDKIERITAVAEADPDAMVVMNDAALTGANLNETGLTKLGQIRSAGFKDSAFVMGCCVAVRRELLDLCLPIPEECNSHDDWIVGIGDGLGRKRIILDVLQYYRRYGDNESQFIVNRLSRVTRWHVRIHQIRQQISRFTKNSQISDSKHKYEWFTLLLNWSESVSDDVPSVLRVDLRRFSNSLQLQIEQLEQRELIRCTSGLHRIKIVFQFWWRGGYKNFSGVQSAIRDLIFR